MEFPFEKLQAWQLSRTLVKDVYVLLEKFPATEKYALCNQIRRAIVSVPSNLAEGTSRFSNKEQLHYVEIAFGSLMETMCQLIIAGDMGFINEVELADLKSKFQVVAKMLSGLRVSLKRKIDEQK